MIHILYIKYEMSGSFLKNVFARLDKNQMPQLYFNTFSKTCNKNEKKGGR